MCWPEPLLGKTMPLLTRVHYGGIPELVRNFLVASCKGALGYQPYLPPFLPSLIKHEAFAEEREWRIIAVDPPLKYINFRSGNSNIRPYVELSWWLAGRPRNKLPLVSITFGPTLRSEDQTEDIIGWMLAKNGYTGVSIQPSGIPFRL
jgi:hypothetical protein